MDKVNVSNIKIIPLKRIYNKNGDIFHGLKKTDTGFKSFEEVYFSRVNYKAIKGWKKHLEMTMNLIVPFGNVKFVFMDSSGAYRTEIIGESNYSRLIIPPGFWFGFQGLSKSYSIVTNIANREHDPTEVKRKSIDEIEFKWI